MINTKEFIMKAIKIITVLVLSITAGSAFAGAVCSENSSRFSEDAKKTVAKYLPNSLGSTTDQSKATGRNSSK